MNKYLLYFLVLSSSVCLSQDWQLIHPNWKYNYQIDTANVISNTVWVDSMNYSTPDSIYFLNKVYQHCDTCTSALGGWNACDTCYAFLHADVFLGSTISCDTAGSCKLGNRIVETRGAVGLSWLFDSTNSVTATVDAIYLDSVFNQLDSVKRIVLNSSDTILLSHSFGILQWPLQYGNNIYYRLKGIEGPNLGEKVPGFYEYFDFHPGDMFEFLSLWSANGGSYPSSKTLRRRFTVLNRTQNSDSLIYSCQYYDVWTFNDYGQYYSGGGSAITDWIFVDSSQHVANKYFNEPLLIKGMYFDFSTEIASPTGAPGTCQWYRDDCIDFCNVYAFTRLDRDMDNSVLKSFGTYDPLDYSNPTGFFGDNMLLMDSSIGLLNSYYSVTSSSQYSLTMKPGLGIISKSYNANFENFCFEVLTAYVKNGDTTGVFTDIHSAKVTDECIIFPLPASESVNVYAPIKSYNIRIMNAVGKLVHSDQSNSENAKLSTSQLPDGIYFIEISGQNKRYTKRFCVVH